MEDKIEIIELGLDEDLKKDIEDSAKLSDDIQIKLKNQVQGMTKQMINKKAQEKKKWEGKLDIIYEILLESYERDPQKHVPKTTIIEAISCSDKELSSTILRFKRYLRTTKEDKWTLMRKKVRGITSYALAPFA